MTPDPTTARPATPLARIPGEALWPTMLRAPGLALRPERVIVMLLAVLLSWILASIPLPWESSRSLSEVWASLITIPPDVPPWLEGPAMFEGRILGLANEHLLTLFVPGLPIAAIMVLASAAVARMCAVEFGLGMFLTLLQGVRFALARAGSLAAAIALPVILVLAAWVIMAAGGAVLLRVPGIDVLGAVAYILAVLAAVAVTILLFGLFFAWPLLVPAIVCESVGTGEFGHGDAVDGLQRSLAYTLNAPVRLGLYGGIGLAQTILASWIAGALALGATGFARGAVTAWLPAQRLATLPTSTAGHLMGLVETLPALLAVACIASVATAAATIAYLLLRRFCDGQDERELWIPAGPAPAARDAERPAPDDQDDE